MIRILWAVLTVVFLCQGAIALATDIQGYGPPAPGPWATTDFYLRLMDVSETTSNGLIRALADLPPKSPIVLVIVGDANDFNFLLMFYVVSVLAVDRPVWGATCPTPEKPSHYRVLPAEPVRAAASVIYHIRSATEVAGKREATRVDVIATPKGEDWTSFCP